VYNVAYILVITVKSIHVLSLSRPDAAPFQNPQGEEPNGDLPDEISRRNVISNLAKHVLFSKEPSQTLIHSALLLVLGIHGAGLVCICVTGKDVILLD
jgi:hypothetical protein